MKPGLARIPSVNREILQMYLHFVHQGKTTNKGEEGGTKTLEYYLLSNYYAEVKLGSKLIKQNNLIHLFILR